ncbi:HipA domain-containing protein [Mitsuaria sp. CC2]|uniref:HipA domain-containing protein n=1 Tax=Mitsuaria sp. CC2 TaxID=3029186 RepID=UPI003B8AB7DF
MNGVEVWLDEHEVGWLKPADALSASTDSPRRLSLAYLERWTSEVLAFPLAPSLPMPPRGGPGSESTTDAVQAFFDHLLPSGQARSRTFAALGLREDDRYGALRLMGRDLPGAVRLIADGLQRPAGPVQRAIDRAELSERLRHRDKSPFAVWDGQVRGALGGDQDQLAVYVERDGGWHLADGPQMASTHVLHPAPSAQDVAGVEGADDQTFNDYFCMRLAARVGLDVAPVQLHRVPEPVLLVERADRQRLDDGRVRRLHTINACQALGVPPADQDRVSLAQLFSLLAHSPAPLVDSRALLRWTIFRQLIGSKGTGAADLSFFVDHGGLRVAPAQGFVGDGTDDNAEDGANSRAFDAQAWADLARDGDIAPRSLTLELKRLCELVRAQAEGVARDLAGEVPQPVIERVLGRILAESDRQAALASEISK